MTSELCSKDDTTNEEVVRVTNDEMVETREEYINEIYELQQLINTGDAWRLEGSIGRAAMGAITAGECMLGEEGHRDYWGNYVPSRYEVEEGTKGSESYCVERASYEAQEAHEMLSVEEKV